MDAFAVLVWWCYLLGPPAAALITCLVCRRHRVLLRLGGGLLVGSVGAEAILELLNPFPYISEQAFVAGLLTWLTVPLLMVASVILLTGGLVRWGLARRRSRRAPSGGTPEPAGGPGPGSPPVDGGEARTAVHCPQCGTDNADTFEFTESCVTCGTALATPRDGAAPDEPGATASGTGRPAGPVATVELSRVLPLNTFLPVVLGGIRVFMDGRELDPIGAGESRAYKVEPGVHSIQVRYDRGWPESLSFDAAEGSRTLFRCGVRVWGRIWLRSHTG
jgi:hypothetical protein